MRITVGRRWFDILVMPGHLFWQGQEYRCRVDHDAGRIEISSLVAPEQRADLAARAVSEGWMHRLADWGLIPVVGSVS